MKPFRPTVLAILALVPLTANADYATVTHSQLQALEYDGSAYVSHWTAEHPTRLMYPVELVGVVINNPGDMCNSSNSIAQPEWQVFIQATNDAVASGDFGGTALYMRKHIPWASAQDYTDSEWTSEINRVMYSGSDGKSLSYGDIVLVQAKAPGLDYNGKFNINEQHMKSSDYDFSITVLQRGIAPTAADITLADLKDSSDNFIFDTTADSNGVLTRASGCERYQGSLVHLDNLLLSSGSVSSWAASGTVVVKQGGRTFNMALGLDPEILSINAAELATMPFSMTAILDQDGANNSGYYLWLTNAANMSVVPEPGSVLLLVAAGCTGLLLWRRRSQPGAR
jgi:hypothetical protein